MTAITNNKIAQAISLFLREEKPETVKRIINFLVLKRLISQSKDILEKLEKIINFNKRVVKVKVSSSKKINEELKKDLEHFLKKRYEAREIVFNEHLDEKLLGGFKIEINDEVIDLTIKNKIRKLQEHLIKGV